MTYTLKINARNDLHLPQEIMRGLNLGEDRIVKVRMKGNVVILIPVDLESRYSKEELRAIDHVHEDEKKKGFLPLESDEDIDRLLE